MLTAVERGEKIATMLHWHAKGLSQRDVAEQVGLSQRWVCLMLAKLKIKPNGHGSAMSRKKKSISTSTYFRLKRFQSAVATTTETAWEAEFPLERGTLNPRYGYFLFAALVRLGVIQHAEPTLQILPRERSFVVRASQDRLREIVAAMPAGTLLRVSDERCVIGSPVVRAIKPRSELRAWCVTMKGYTEPDSLAVKLREELSRIGVVSRVRVAVQERRTVKIKGKVIVGFAVAVSRLDPRESLVLQAVGLGGRRRFGCGVFVAC